MPSEEKDREARPGETERAEPRGGLPSVRYSHPRWINDAAPQWFRGTVYVDGSGKACRWLRELSTAAWAAVTVRDDMVDIDPVNEDGEGDDEDKKGRKS